MAFFTCGQLKKIKKKMSNQRHILDFVELDGGGGFFGRKKITRTKSEPKIL